MKISIAVLAAALALAATAGGAGANGSPFSPGLDYGWEGVRAPSGDVRYITLATPNWTTVAAISVRGGRVVRSRAFAAASAYHSSPTTARPRAFPATEARSSSLPTARCPENRVSLAFAHFEQGR